MDFSKLVSELGLGAALSIMVFVAFFFLLKWVLGVSSDQLRYMAEERKTWAKSQEGFLVQMQGLQEQIRTNMATNRAFFDTVQEAHKCQRAEHDEMIKCLGRINGYKS